MLGAEKLYKERTVKPSNINNRGYEQASTLGFLWLRNIDPDGVAQQRRNSDLNNRGTPLECIYYSPVYPQVIRPAVIVIGDRAAVKSHHHLGLYILSSYSRVIVRFFLGCFKV